MNGLKSNPIRLESKDLDPTDNEAIRDALMEAFRFADKWPASLQSFNARLRDELLNGEIFYTLREAQIVIESWRRHYNTIRRHASIVVREEFKSH